MTSHRSESTGRLYLARHGRTALNARGLLRGRLDPDLDDVGREEARRLADLLAGSGITVVVSSPLSRALQTAEAIAESQRIAVRTDPRLADRDYDRWAGWSIEELEAEWGSVDDAPGVEPMAEVLARGLEALEEIRRTGRSPAVAVSHDVVNRAVLSALETSFGSAREIPQPTGCVNVLEWEQGDWSVSAAGVLPQDAELEPLEGTSRMRRSDHD